MATSSEKLKGFALYSFMQQLFEKIRIVIWIKTRKYRKERTEPQVTLQQGILFKKKAKSNKMQFTSHDN